MPYPFTPFSNTIWVLYCFANEETEVQADLKVVKFNKGVGSGGKGGFLSQSGD